MFMIVIQREACLGIFYLGLKALLHYALFHWRFSFYLTFFILPRVFPRVLDTNMLVSKTRVKTREKREKNARKIKNASPTRDNFSILHYALGKNASQLRFSHVFLEFFLAFLFTNANQKHSVIGALVFILWNLEKKVSKNDQKLPVF